MVFKNLSLNNITFLINNGKMHFQNISLNNCNFRLSNDCEIVFNNVNIIYSNLFKNNVVELRFNYSNNLHGDPVVGGPSPGLLHYSGGDVLGESGCLDIVL